MDGWVGGWVGASNHQQWHAPPIGGDARRRRRDGHTARACGRQQTPHTPVQAVRHPRGVQAQDGPSGSRSIGHERLWSPESGPPQSPRPAPALGRPPSCWLCVCRAPRRASVLRCSGTPGACDAGAHWRKSGARCGSYSRSSRAGSCAPITVTRPSTAPVPAAAPVRGLLALPLAVPPRPAAALARVPPAQPPVVPVARHGTECQARTRHHGRPSNGCHRERRIWRLGRRRARRRPRGQGRKRQERGGQAVRVPGGRGRVPPSSGDGALRARERARKRGCAPLLHAGWG